MMMGGRAAEACPRRSEAEMMDAVVARILAATCSLYLGEECGFNSQSGCDVVFCLRRGDGKRAVMEQKEKKKIKVWLSTSVGMRSL
jgi:hypothetical protein